jgi:hypothetical protein
MQSPRSSASSPTSSIPLFWLVYCSVDVLQHKCGLVLARTNKKLKHEQK